jgi:hypothetical protein
MLAHTVPPAGLAPLTRALLHNHGCTQLMQYASCMVTTTAHGIADLEHTSTGRCVHITMHLALTITPVQSKAVYLKAKGNTCTCTTIIEHPSSQGDARVMYTTGGCSRHAKPASSSDC